MQKDIAGRICGLCRPPPLKTLHRSLLPDFTLENPDDELQSEFSLYRTPLKAPRVKTCKHKNKRKSRQAEKTFLFSSCRLFLCQKRDSNPYGRNAQGILSPRCLPFHHSGSIGNNTEDIIPRLLLQTALPL